jgi:hypothetical protein
MFFVNNPKVVKGFENQTKQKAKKGHHGGGLQGVGNFGLMIVENGIPLGQPCFVKVM